MSDIIGPASAKAVLEALLPSIESSLQAIQSAPEADKIKAMEAAKKRLSDFFNSTRAQNLADAAEVNAVRQIDQIAFDAFTQLTVQQVTLGVGVIKQGAERLKALAAALDLQTANTSSAAKSVALQPVKKALDQMTAMVNSVKALKTNLSAADPDQAKVAAEIDKLITQFENVRKAIGGTPG